ncbi:MAG: hypothetical protein LUQ17_05070, partial [Methanomicrobiales archaeon]|nr:hypothetical protein [Methanomicrobiales archaeon]
GYGKRTSFDEFRGHGRGTMGVRNIITLGSRVVTAMAVSSGEEIIMMSASGIVMRTRVDGISIQKRNTRGVRVMRLDEGDRLVGIAVIPAELEDQMPEPTEGPMPLVSGDSPPEPSESPIPESEKEENPPPDQKVPPPPLWMNP